MHANGSSPTQGTGTGRIAPRRSLAGIAALVAMLVAGCEIDPDAGRVDEGPPRVGGETGLPMPALLARTVDPERLFVVVDINGTSRRLDAPDASGRWILRHEVTENESLDIDVTWWDTLGGPDSSAIPLATLSRSLPSVSADDSLAIGADDYTSDFDEDRDGSTNLEEVAAGSDPLEAAGPIDVPDPTDRDPALADVPGSDFYRFANNSARLQGPVIGNGGVPNASLSRPLPFRVETAGNGLEIVGVNVLALGADNSTVVLVVANRSTRLRCFVRADYTLESTRAPTVDLGFVFVNGTLGLNGGDYTSTCVGPGSLAFATVLLDIAPDTLSSITVDSVGASDNDGFDPPGGAIVEPVSYRVVDGVTTFLVANRTAATLEMRSLRAMLLDDEGFPVGFLAVFPDDRSLAPGQERELILPPLFLGSATTVRALVTLTGAAG